MRRSLVVLMLGVLIGALITGTAAFASGRADGKTAPPATRTTRSVQAQRLAIRASLKKIEASVKADRASLQAEVKQLGSRRRGKRAAIRSMIAAMVASNHSDRVGIESAVKTRTRTVRGLDAETQTLRAKLHSLGRTPPPQSEPKSTKSKRS